MPPEGEEEDKAPLFYVLRRKEDATVEEEEVCVRGAARSWVGAVLAKGGDMGYQ